MTAAEEGRSCDKQCIPYACLMYSVFFSRISSRIEHSLNEKSNAILNEKVAAKCADIQVAKVANTHYSISNDVGMAVMIMILSWRRHRQSV